MNSAAKLVKPGGKLLIEEVDISSISANKAFPALMRYKELWGEVIKVINCDAERGRKLEGYFQEAGLRDINASYYPVTEPQNKIKEVISGLMKKTKVQNLMKRHRLVKSQREIDELIVDLSTGFLDPEMKIYFYNLYQVSGTKV